MDEIVREAMARWPDVPAVYGWLRLERRGRWMLVDRGAPGFDEARDGAGSEITNRQITAFIERNYASDASGRWYFQNGPQRVFVDLDVAPLVLRVTGSGRGARLAAHTGAAVDRVDAAWRTPDGALVLATDAGHGVVHDMDVTALRLEGDDRRGLRLLLGDASIPVGDDHAALAQAFVRRPRQDAGTSRPR